jgi:hypothetical protein
VRGRGMPRPPVFVATPLPPTSLIPALLEYRHSVADLFAGTGTQEPKPIFPAHGARDHDIHDILAGDQAVDFRVEYKR